MKRPSFQFYPGDWLRDTALRTCSVGARGLWIDMICLMHDGTPYGYLKVNHKVILPPNLSRMVGATLQEIEGWVAELEEAGVFDRDEDGAIFSRRMVRDETIRQARASGGKLGGNPALKVNQKVTDKVNLPANLQPTPSSSSSSSSASSVDTTPSTPLKGEVAKCPLQLRAEALMRRRSSTPWSVTELRAWKNNRAAIESTTDHEWAIMQAFYTAPQKETYARKDLAALLNNWTGEIDKARAWNDRSQSTAADRWKPSSPDAF